jgi:hypothetical protein
MGKNPQKYKYLDIGLAWDSWTLAQLEADAKMHQMDDQPAKLAAVRLTEYYRLVSLGVIVPGVSALTPAGAVGGPPALAAPPPASASDDAAKRQQMTAPHRRGSAPAMEPPTTAAGAGSTLEESDQAGENAAAALDYFLDEDEEE